ncbi:MAG TPA: FeoA family protein [Candidatus Krumholzibacteria bacterium]|nr:FeoA family protein [Candidatus Krumholzibacteria bacterium]
MNDMRLDHLAPGAEAIVLAIDGEGPSVRRLMDLGFVPGTPVRFIRSAPLGDPLELVVRGMHLSLRRSEAARVHVEPV